MRILERVDLPEIQIRCDCCYSLLSYNKRDIKYRDEEVFGDWHSVEEIICPVCNGVIIVTIDGEPFRSRGE